MIKLPKENLAGKRKRVKDVKVSFETRPIMVKDLKILDGFVMKEKSGLSRSLKNLDKGNLTFPREELNSLMRSVDDEVKEFTTDSNLRNTP